MSDQLTDLHQYINRITDLVRHELATRPRPQSRNQESNNESRDYGASENAKTQQQLLDLIDVSDGAEYSVRVLPGGPTCRDLKSFQPD
jgi:hypothetical protein